MGPGWQTTCRFNLLYNLHGFGPWLPIHGANNTIVDSWVINLTFPPTTCRVAVLVINQTSPHTKNSNNKSYYHKYTKGPQDITKSDTSFGGQMVEPLGLQNRWVGLEMHTLAALPPILNWRLWLVDLHWCSLFNLALCRPSHYLLVLLWILKICSKHFFWQFNGRSQFLLRFLRVDLIPLFVTNLVVELRLFNGQKLFLYIISLILP